MQEGRGKPVFVTYWLNQLQNLQTDKMVRFLLACMRSFVFSVCLSGLFCLFCAEAKGEESKGVHFWLVDCLFVCLCGGGE